ncbi:MAG: 2,3,4,5-tetrahydropyridine-2,6-dicarboxylate N-succinyltransferase [Actinobacteria bacterium]|nr:2,3,4,5-tetrahydropyridine-2,6-dicarboxylate N-succinyltransferase [Actinomycetota bacterium]MCB9388152.1 2,3,4,5-tetrahydropyridine-2,6-dicarboxylate N-succinyltransferase [Acidimicrobiia bacterium]
MIGDLWEHRDDMSAVMSPEQAKDAIYQAIELLDSGQGRCAEVVDGDVVVHQWLKQAVLLLFRVQAMETIELGPFEFADKIPLKTNYMASRVRVVPGASARWGSYLAPGVTMMPSYVNIGAYVDEGTLVDTWATVGSCASIGKNVHLSGGVGIGGVLEPPQAAPVVVEDDAFIGSRCIVVEGARVRRGAKLGAGVVLTSSTPVIDSATGEEISRGDVPERAVAIAATRNREFEGGTFGLPCVLVLRTLAPGEEHDKLKLNAILREHGVAT